MTNIDVVQKLWNFCNTLRHDGIGYSDYIEQLTYVLFLKISHERSLHLPQEHNWPTLRNCATSKLLENYQKTLQVLGNQKGILGSVFLGAISRFRESSNLRKLILLIDETNWSSIDVDLTGNTYEGLLQKCAAE